MDALQAAVLGAITGTLMRKDFVLADVTQLADDNGNYLPKVYVRGQQSGRELVVEVREPHQDEQAEMQAMRDTQEATTNP